MDIKACLESLCTRSGPSGRERAAAEAALGWIQPEWGFSTKEIDRFGNLVAYRPCGKPNAKKI